MIRTQGSLASIQLGRNTPAEILESEAPLREAALESFRRRNAALDALFYDVRTVTPAEAHRLGPWFAREGALLLVPPTGKGALDVLHSVDDLVANGGRDARALVVAGVGSSALGSAAFARNVADAFDAPVVAVVSGYGLADLLTEAAGGWFWFRTMNGIRHRLEELDHLARAREIGTSDGSLRNVGRLSLDTRVVGDLIADRRLRFSLLAGHSKGNLVLSEALFEATRNERRPSGAIDGDTWVVTLSAAIHMPACFERIVDVMGAMDWFGAINSRMGVGIEMRWPNAWHHTNTELPFHLPVRAAFERLIDERRIRL